MKAILLVRISSISQQLDEQTSNLISFAQSKGYPVDNLIIIEDIESGIKLDEEERNGLNKMKAEISADKKINAVFVWELSRLFRKQKVGYNLREYFIDNQINLFCSSPSFQLLNEDWKSINESGDILFMLYAQLAEAEMRNKKARFHRSKIRNARTGKYSGGFLKYGYSVNKLGYYEINEVEAELIRYIFNEYENGKSMMKLMKELKERGLVNTSFFVRGTLISDCYTGISNQYGMNRVYPQIISVEQFNRCREIAKENNRRADKTNEIYFCRKLIKCTECGTHYIAMKSSLMYLCYGRYGKEARINPETACKNSPVLNLNLLDSLVWHVVKEREIFQTVFDQPQVIEKMNQQIETNREKINNCIKQIHNEEKKRERNNTMYFNGQISDEKYNSNSKLIDEKVKDFKNIQIQYENENMKFIKMLQEIDKREDDLSDFENKEEYLNQLDDSGRQLLIQKYITEINIFDDIPNTTKIVVINYDSLNSERYRIHIKKKPYLIEYDHSWIDEDRSTKYSDFNPMEYFLKPTDWIEFPVEIEKRFERKKVIK